MASAQALASTALACTFWVDRDEKKPHIRVYYQGSNFSVHEVKWDNGAWKPGSQPVFTLDSRSPLAAIAYPGDDDDNIIPPANPAIHIYYIDHSGSSPQIKDWVKSEGTDVWSYNGIVPTFHLSPISALAATEYSDPFIRLYYQDTSGCIRECRWSSETRKWTDGADSIISRGQPFLGTPIGADTDNTHDSGVVTVAWLDQNQKLAGASVENDQDDPSYCYPLVLPDCPASKSGSITVAMWSEDKIHIYYDGDNDGIQKIEKKIEKTKEQIPPSSAKWSGPINSFTGDITNPNIDGQGALASAAFSPGNAGDHVGSVFYQPVGNNNIVEVLL
ncbi:hypothetical protein SISSUDRAFT_1125415 [Sistotremastrum suecicum HHB10207 ss-3]|uniref:Uncharacterized protein n=1 Tax=Sistotremastrum suecicum HHB10207 ss-3 TaxID=1314776 RepID=A0A166HLW7_9AGAM|nr:hypothetical protein SISSUDRAFT_1125415 [Sistotremastrum suecicum HHB10207 ss-3]